MKTYYTKDEEQNLRDDLQSELERNQKNLEETKTKLLGNITHQLPWIADDLYMQDYKSRYLKDLIASLDGPEDDPLKNFRRYFSVQVHNIKETLKAKIYNFDPQHSTGVIHNLSEEWKLNAHKDLLRSFSQCWSTPRYQADYVKLDSEGMIIKVK